MGIRADMTSYNILLKACCLSGRVDMAQDIYREVQHLESSGELKLDVFTYSTIIKVLNINLNVYMPAMIKKGLTRLALSTGALEIP